MLALAWRNVRRHARRSLITIAAVALGLGAMLFLWGFNDGIHNTMTRNLQEVIVGSLQVHAQGFFRRPSLARMLPDARRVEALLEREGLPHAPRLRAFALAAGRETSEGLTLLAVDPARERRVTRIAGKVTRGRFLRDAEAAECVLGRTSARNLGLRVGDEVVVLTEDRFGAMAAERLRLVGIIDSGETGIDRGLMLLPLRFTQRLLSLEGRLSGFVAQVPPDRLAAVARTLRHRLGAEYEVLRWDEMYPMMRQWVELENGFYYIFLGVVLLIVAAGVANTVLAGTLDRVHEFGVMMALGCSRARLAGMVLAETAMLGLAGVAAGAASGLALIARFHAVGIDMRGFMDTIGRFYIDPVIRTEINTDHLAATLLSVLGASLLAGLWPALRAARLEPVEAIRDG